MNCVAICLCINYTDYLAQGLPLNRPLFSHFYVITEESDTETIELANAYNCTILYTKLRNAHGSTFNKSGMTHEAQKLVHKLHPDSWIALIDADIGLPANLWSNQFDTKILYGIPRARYDTKADLENQTPNTTIEKYANNPIGFFQLYYDKTKYYPVWAKNCSACGLEFMYQFNKRQMIKGAQCIHYGPIRTNWDGRKSAAWDAGKN